jgi:2-oxoglutarate ferredoxin oxidoreductase subunit beta
MHPIAEKMLRKDALPSIYCPGCGHGTVLNAFVHAVDELDIFDDLALVGGIGCAGWTPVFVNRDTIHTLHGRDLAVATGIKLVQPSRKVVVFAGDGDTMAIGGNHFIHAARRNIDLTLIMMNNQIYGMTGGQVAPTTPGGARTQTSPHGNPEPEVDACKLASCAGATYVARWSSAHPRQLKKAIAEAINHPGFAFVEAAVQCPTQAGRYMHGTGNPVDIYKHIKKSCVPLKKARDMQPDELMGRIVVGKFHEDAGRPEYASRVHGLIKKTGGANA